MARYKVERKTLSEQVAEQLEADILEGRLKENDQLPAERELVEQFGVGRPAVREALFYLQRLGLIAHPRRYLRTGIRPAAEAVMARLSGVTRSCWSGRKGSSTFRKRVPCSRFPWHAMQPSTPPGKTLPACARH